MKKARAKPPIQHVVVQRKHEETAAVTPTEPVKAETAKKLWWEEACEKAKTIRDFILIGAGVTYVVGFVFWSIVSYANGLGPSAASQAQYVTFGFWTVGEIGVFVGAFTLGRFICRETRRSQIVFWGLMFVTVVAFFAADISSFTNSIGQISEPISLTLATIFFSTAVGFYLQERIHLEAAKQFRIVIRIYFWALVFGCMAHLIAVVSTIPQEFGGTKARCAYISVKRSDLSQEERTALLPAAYQPPPIKDDPAPVVRSNKLNVLFDNGDELEVQPLGSTDKAVYEIKRSNIVNITWYGYQFPK